ncbi:hypothetical protein EA658_09900 [Pseudoxanthomonas winnipegensis]|uniref:Uncharacterized protein n=1 Tax=Pseudoxanthomonas winnipegensis TaxID=2480810 RepID=A0ABY1WCW8_9GAMM|nr:hypothetical protein [Pseudoxanthomonas winnipegensis]TAA12455.1 hypothetical protein EA659_03750 [Pseudoxanthomonas winnipegensis]TAA19180.1 hypothetical protein EA658_09900 [Pseudoxanthomonas winnipegensis]TAH70441.1 hypothetical protein EA657_16965 [Pseudoxanthomonas winnipegensis]
MNDAIEERIHLAACARCGSAAGPRMRERPEGAFRVACESCGAMGRESASTPEAAASIWCRFVPLPHVVPAPSVLVAEPPKAVAAPGARIVVESPEVLELLGRLLVGSSYKVPVEGRGSKPGLQPADIAGAVGMMRDPLAREVALAVAQRLDERKCAPQIVQMSYARIAYVVARMRPRTLDLREPADCHRLRLVIYDAAAALVCPTKQAPASAHAKAAKMRKDGYLRVHKAATSVLQAVLSEASGQLRRKLFD